MTNEEEGHKRPREAARDPWEFLPLPPGGSSAKAGARSALLPRSPRHTVRSLTECRCNEKVKGLFQYGVVKPSTSAFEAFPHLEPDLEWVSHSPVLRLPF